MTVAVAVYKNNLTVLAADSLVNFGGQRFSSENGQFHKIHRIGDSLMAWAGWSLYGELINAHLADKPTPPLENEAQVFSFFVAFWRAIRDEYTFTQGPSSRSEPFADLDSVFLLVNSGGIFQVASDMDVTQFQQYSAIGSGAKYALGALRVLYNEIEDPVEIARRAVQVGIDLDVYCGGQIDIETIRARPRPPRPLTPARRTRDR